MTALLRHRAARALASAAGKTQAGVNFTLASAAAAAAAAPKAAQGLSPLRRLEALSTLTQQGHAPLPLAQPPPFSRSSLGSLPALSNVPHSPPPSPHVWRPLSTHVGHGSGGREKGHTLHEPPAGHPFAVKGLNHIALAVPSLASASEHYRTVFGAQVSDPHPLPAHGVTVVFVHVGSTTLELLEPLGERSPIAKFLEKNPRGGIHHLCFTVDNIDVASQHVADEGVHVLGDYASEATPAADGEKPAPMAQIGAHGNPVIFLDPRDNLGVLCELEQVFCHER